MIKQKWTKRDPSTKSSGEVTKQYVELYVFVRYLVLIDICKDTLTELLNKSIPATKLLKEFYIVSKISK